MKQLFTITLSLFVFALHAQAEIKGYSCGGTEPFYSLQIKGNTLTLDFVGEDVSTMNVVGPLNAAGLVEGNVTVYKNAANDVNVSIVSGTCSDGMSENEYGYHMVYTKGESVLYGCCEPFAQD